MENAGPPVQHPDQPSTVPAPKLSKTQVAAIFGAFITFVIAVANIIFGTEVVPVISGL